MPALDSLRLVGSHGANRAMEAELKRLNPRWSPGNNLPKPRRVDEQTLVYPFDASLAWLALNYLRTSSRVLWDWFEAEAPRLEALYDELLNYFDQARPRWLTEAVRPDDKHASLGISVRARDVRAFPASASQIQGTVKNALIAGAALHGVTLHLEPDRPDLSFSVRGTQGPLVLSLDLAGHSQHERGYRLDRVEAPIRENIAAQILMLARWDPRRETLFDPMCGSGTFLIEGALMADAAPLWHGPRPLAAHYPVFEGAKLPPTLFPGAKPTLIGSDRDRAAIQAAQKNAERAGVAHRIQLFRCAVEDLDPERLNNALGPEVDVTQGGLLVANPPYGERLKEDDLLGNFEALRDHWRALPGPWRAAFIVAHPDFERVIDLAPALKKPARLGQLPAYLYVYDAVTDGSNQRD